MRLGIDLDGVVADFNAGWVSLYNDQFDRELASDMVTSWGGMIDLTHFTDMGEFWRWAGQGDGHSIFRHLDTYPGAVETLEQLSVMHDIVIITTKPDWAIHDTFAWLSDHRIPTREVHILEDKWTVPCDVYLDDAPHQIEAIHANRPESAMVRFVRAWNEPRPGVHDVADWDEFLSLVGRLAERGTS